MSKKDTIVMAAVVGTVMLWVGFFIVGAKLSEIKYQSEAIERGVAEYNQTTGNWQWRVSVQDEAIWYKGTTPSDKKIQGYDADWDEYGHTTMAITVGTNVYTNLVTRTKGDE